ncbi:MAG TPA: nickel-dependent hydrogenase large subunit [Syntrophomonadaceae bacterium]|nr:nickel-dependent hydrogenase large subunit [Syntrophomonadaceae bacterium]
MPQKIVIDPVTRIEGHLKVEVQVEGGKVVDAKCSGTLFRGLELIMIGRDPRDAQQIMQRICGVCPTGHATAGTLALDNAFGIEPPPNGRIIRNLILGANYVQSHILHFFHLAALDYVKGPDIPPFIPRYEADYRLPKDINDAAVDNYLKALEMRRKAQEMLAIWGGRMPHVQAIVPGGVTEVPDTQKIFEFKSRLGELIDFVDNVYVPTVKKVAEAYSDWFDIGRGCQNMMAYGAFPLEEGMNHVKKEKFFPAGIYLRGQFRAFEPEKIAEEVKYSWYKDNTGGDLPTQAVITPDPTKKDAYSYLKAPRYNGEPMEVGPLARQWVAKQKDVAALGEKAFSVMGRHFARAVETSAVAHAMDEWVLKLEPGKPVCTPSEIPASAQGMGLTEAARGALGHWHKIEHHRTKVLNAVVPTTWNASPKDGKGVNGPMEQAIIGAPIKDPNNPVEVVRIIRSFDPCFGCAIHLMTPDKKTISQFTIN